MPKGDRTNCYMLIRSKTLIVRSFFMSLWVWKMCPGFKDRSGTLKTIGLEENGRNHGVIFRVAVRLQRGV